MFHNILMLQNVETRLQLEEALQMTECLMESVKFEADGKKAAEEQRDRV